MWLGGGKKGVTSGYRGGWCLLLSCDWIRKQDRRSKVVVYSAQDRHHEWVWEPQDCLVTAKITNELHEARELSFRCVWRDCTRGRGKRREELSWRISSSFMIDLSLTVIFQYTFQYHKIWEVSDLRCEHQTFPLGLGYYCTLLYVPWLEKGWEVLS